jgi:UDP-glucose:(heptosyl)LPS alpha-1,3-glucosyltransferase
MQTIALIKYHLNNKGGLEKYFFAFLHFLIKKNYLVTILTNDSTVILNLKNTKVITFQAKNKLKFLKIKNFDKLVNDYLIINPFDFIFSFDRITHHNYTRLGNGVHLSFLKKRMLIENSFKTFLNKINPLHKTTLDIEKKSLTFPKLKKIIANSAMVKNELIDYYQINPEKIKVIHNGVDFIKSEKEFFAFFDNKNKYFEKINLNPNNFNLLFVGNDFKRKGLDLLLLALKSLENKNIFLSILGWDRKIYKYKKLIRKLKIENKVKFFNKVTNVNDFYKCSNALILPTIYDPFSNVVIEALSMGLFSITSSHNGAKEIINSRNGYIIDDITNIYKIKKSILFAMQLKNTKENKINIRNSVKHLDFSNQLNQLLTILDE